jgi:hypothetical protein
MRNAFLLLAFAMLPLSLGAQWSVRAGYMAGQSDMLDDLFIRQSGPYGMIEYGFRLKEKRIEFHPGIGYLVAPGAENPEGRLNAFLLDFDVAVYPFDFGGDCNCPTFSKDGEVFKKGFFLAVTPGLALQQFKRTANLPGIPEPTTSTDDQLSGTLGVSAGLDLGLSDRLTLTPLVSYTRYFSTTFDTEGVDMTPWTLTDQGYFGFGVRLTHHPDDRRRRSRR